MELNVQDPGNSNSRILTETKVEGAKQPRRVLLVLLVGLLISCSLLLAAVYYRKNSVANGPLPNTSSNASGNSSFSAFSSLLKPLPGGAQAVNPKPINSLAPNVSVNQNQFYQQVGSNLIKAMR